MTSKDAIQVRPVSVSAPVAAPVPAGRPAWGRGWVVRPSSRGPGPRRVLAGVLNHRYGARLLFVATGILTLSMLDAHWTLVLLEAGIASELNPLMLALMEYDVQLFVIAKGVITGAGVVALVACAGVSPSAKLRAALALHGLLAIYVVLIGYEFLLLNRFL